MTLVDTSAWIEFLRGTGSATHRALAERIRDGTPLHTTDVVIMEVLAGGRDDAHTGKLRRLMATCRFVPTSGLDDFESAAALYRRCRRAGQTPRSLNDCLVAAIAIRAGLDVLHADRDFDAIGQTSTLRLA